MKKILLISYYFEPFNGVGAKRMSYWANAFFREPATRCVVITATPQPVQRPGVIHIPHNRGKADSFIFGLSWIKPVKKYLGDQMESFDFIVISGGPFGHFGLVFFLKQRFPCKVALDFRDPFSGNVRFGSLGMAEYFKRSLEKIVLRKSDYVLTVNECCKTILARNAPSNKIIVIENGYDETVLDAVSGAPLGDAMIHIGHAGKFYTDPSNFIETMLKFNNAHTEKSFAFHHIGKPDENLSRYTGPFVVQHGEQSYAETVRILKSCTAGFLMTRGEFLEYNTKIFDYIGCDLDIFIVTKGRPESGCIHGLTERVSEKVFWMRDEPEEMYERLERFHARNLPVPRKENFSRRAGFLRLKQLFGISA